MLTPTEAADLRRLLIDRGDCLDAPDPDAWHPDEPDWAVASILGDTAAGMAEYEDTARTLCGACPVRSECLTLALDEEVDLPRSWIHGVRGGLAPWQRYQKLRTIRRHARREVA